jgi:hypothetical protein
MPLVTRKSVTEKLGAYLRRDLSLSALVDWAESALMSNDFDPTHLTTIRDAVARIGAADVRTFGLAWDDCEQLLSQLGYSAQVNIVAR